MGLGVPASRCRAQGLRSPLSTSFNWPSLRDRKLVQRLHTSSLSLLFAFVRLFCLFKNDEGAVVDSCLIRRIATLVRLLTDLLIATFPSCTVQLDIGDVVGGTTL